MKIYLSGPIGTGDDMERNIQRFREVAAELRRNTDFEVVSPVELDHPANADWATYLKGDLRAMFDCDAVYCLEGWENSPGAQLEVSTALKLGLKRFRNGIEDGELTAKETFLQGLAAEPEGTRFFAVTIGPNGDMAQRVIGPFQIWELQGIARFLSAQFEMAAVSMISRGGTPFGGEDEDDSDRVVG